MSDVVKFSEAILHGDASHRAWLREAARQWLEDGTVPPPRPPMTLWDEIRRALLWATASAWHSRADYHGRMHQWKSCDSARISAREIEAYLDEFLP